MPNRLLDVVCGAEQGTALCALDFVVNITTSRKVPRSLSMHLTGDSLVGLAQKIAGARIIAASKVSCRFTSKCLCSAFCSDAQRFFGSLHAGVASPLGLEEQPSTAFSQYGDRDAASLFQLGMTIVFHNVFKSLDKNALITACRRGIPTLAVWTSWCLQCPVSALV